MKASNRRPFLLLAALLAAFPACTSLDVTAQAGYAQMSLSGDVGYYEPINSSTGGPTGAVNPPPLEDVDSGLGIGGSYGAPYLRAEVDCGVPVLTVSSFSYKASGSGEIQDQFGGIVAGGTPVPVSSDFEVFDVKTTYVFEIPIGPVSIGPGVGLDYLDMKLRVRDVSLADQTANLSVPAPFGVVRGEVDLKWFSFVGELGYMSADVGDVEARIVDIEALLMVRPARWANLFVGYRSLALDAKGSLDGSDYVDANVVLSGFMIGGGFEF